MLNVRIEEKIVKIPQAWSEVSIAQLQKIAGIGSRDNDLAVAFDFFKIFAEGILSEDEIERIDILDFQKIKGIFTFISKEVENKRNEIDIEGQLYSYPQNFEEISLGEWIAAENALKYMMTNRDNNKEIYSQIERLLSIFLRKKVGDEVEKFDLNNSNKNSDLFKEKVDAEFAIFFCENIMILGLEYFRRLTESLKGELREIQNHLKELAQKAGNTMGDGKDTQWIYAKEISLALKRC